MSPRTSSLCSKSAQDIISRIDCRPRDDVQQVLSSPCTSHRRSWRTITSSRLRIDRSWSEKLTRGLRVEGRLTHSLVWRGIGFATGVWLCSASSFAMVLVNTCRPWMMARYGRIAFIAFTSQISLLVLWSNYGLLSPYGKVRGAFEGDTTFPNIPAWKFFSWNRSAGARRLPDHWSWSTFSNCSIASQMFGFFPPKNYGRSLFAAALVFRYICRDWQ